MTLMRFIAASPFPAVTVQLSAKARKRTRFSRYALELATSTQYLECIEDESLWGTAASHWVPNVHEKAARQLLSGGLG